MIPQKYGPMLFGLILSGLMSLLVSGISTFRAVGLSPAMAGLWAGSWLAAWCFAFPAVLLVAPVAQKVVRLLVAEDHV
ncbi:MAG: DUF2798 domain-containing protein [Proteobacteria bacterium]|nr:DUF2798 domain-containing protein [Pseudomonadota bacterium]